MDGKEDRLTVTLRVSSAPSIWKSLGPVLACVVALTLLPLLLCGWAFEERVATWITATVAPLPFALATIGVLAGDVFLPVPSSLVNTLARSR